MIACCGNEISKNEGTASLQRLRNKKLDNVKLKLNNFDIEYNLSYGRWISNLNNFEVDNPEENNLMEKLKDLKKEEENLENENIQLDKEYKSKLAEILIATKVHCQTKSDIQDLFDELGVAHQDFEIIKQYQNKLKKEHLKD